MLTLRSKLPDIPAIFIRRAVPFWRAQRRRGRRHHPEPRADVSRRARVIGYRFFRCRNRTRKTLIWGRKCHAQPHAPGKTLRPKPANCTKIHNNLLLDNIWICHVYFLSKRFTLHSSSDAMAGGCFGCCTGITTTDTTKKGKICNEKEVDFPRARSGFGADPDAARVRGHGTACRSSRGMQS